MPRRLSFAYYCSGHGYGHATRVSAIATHLCSLPDTPLVHIISSAPRLVFQDSINAGARYRYAFIDPVIVQPLAYYVDRRKSVEELHKFLETKDQKLEEEAAWLRENKIDCVLSDAAFLACLAANAAGIPSVLITNFTFDSVYSYLSAPITDSPPVPFTDSTAPSSTNCHCLSPTKAQAISQLLEDTPIPLVELTHLVNELHTGYRCADLLLLLPGHIPIPSFHAEPALPSFTWVDPTNNRFLPEVACTLAQSPSVTPLLPPIGGHRRHRSVRQAPLVVRHPSADIYSPAGRSRLLNSIGVPAQLHGLETKILVVSFGGQVFKKPSSRTTSRSGSPVPGKLGFSIDSSVKRKVRRRKVGRCDSSSSSSSPPETPSNGSGFVLPLVRDDDEAGKEEKDIYPGLNETSDTHKDCTHVRSNAIPITPSSNAPIPTPPSRLATPHHLWVPGAPPSNKPRPYSLQLPWSRHTPRHSVGANTGINITISGVTPKIEQEEWVRAVMTFGTGTDTDSSSEMDTVDDSEDEELPQMLPDSSWIAIVCGASKSGDGKDDEMPERFFTAPRDVYMPDLTAVADVLLGKLGYGTVSECVDAFTPFVYVPRPLFVEEHGLRQFLTTNGVAVELPRAAYEAGDWASSIADAYAQGRDAKSRKRVGGDTGVRKAEMRAMAEGLANWVLERGVEVQDDPTLEGVSA